MIKHIKEGKNFVKVVAGVFAMTVAVTSMQAQNPHHKSDSTQVKSVFKKGKTYIITMNDGTEFTGEIIHDDPRELLVNTQDKGQLYLPKYNIKTIQLLSTENYLNGEALQPNKYGNYYLFSSNALPFKRGEFRGQQLLFCRI